MKTANNPKKESTVRDAYLAKVGTSRQLAIPKKVYDALDLNTGDYMEIVVQNNHLVLTPKTLIDKDTLQGLKEIREGKGIGPFSNAKDAIKALRS
jgi:AbrB family looped-hinge helix DNA binding protein